MAVNIKNVLELLQQKVAAADSADPISDLEILFKATKKASGAYVTNVDSDAALDTIPLKDKLKFSIAGNPLEGTGGGFIRFNTSKFGRSFETYNAPPIPPPWSVRGNSYGYTMGGAAAPLWTYKSDIDKFPFAADGNATAVGNLTQSKWETMGAMSPTDGYALNGFPYNPPTYANNQKFPFATGVAVLLASHNNPGATAALGASTAQNEYQAYTFGGSPQTLAIYKYVFATDANLVTTGNLTDTGGYFANGCSSSTDGYRVGGYLNPPGFKNIIDKWPFAAEGNAVDVGDLVYAKYKHASTSSATHGYTIGGAGPAPNKRHIDKFSFISGGNATAVGLLATSADDRGFGGSQTTENGYVNNVGSGAADLCINIEKFSFASDGNSAVVGTLTVGRERVATASN
jgi:hypothetical protein